MGDAYITYMGKSEVRGDLQALSVKREDNIKIDIIRKLYDSVD
jgi:hypothetical protein